MDLSAVRRLATRPFRLVHYLSKGGDFSGFHRRSVPLKPPKVVQDAGREAEWEIPAECLIPMPGGARVIGLICNSGDTPSSVSKVWLGYWNLHNGNVPSPRRTSVAVPCNLEFSDSMDPKLCYRPKEDDYVVLVDGSGDGR